jgi:chromosome segregation ATPase
MAKKAIKILGKVLIALLILAGAGGSAYLYLELSELQKSHAELNENYDRALTKQARLQQGLKEQRAIQAGLQRQKRALDGQIAKLRVDNQELQESYDTLVADSEKLKTACDERTAKLVGRTQELITLFKRVKSERDMKIREYLRLMDERNVDVTFLNNEIFSLENKLMRSDLRVERCTNHNEELTKIGMDLLSKYEDRSFFDTVLEREPFIQAKQVEVEHFVQRYVDKIDDQEFN